MGKRIIKVLAIVIASCLVVIGGVVGFVAIRGGFKEEVINITKLYFGDDETSVKKEIWTLEDVIANINFEPKNATNRSLKVEVLGNENGIISDLKEITAGEDFTLDIRQDTKGNNIGGVVTIKASQGIAEVQMTVIVDTVIPDKALYFTGDDTGKITTTGKVFTMAISDRTQYVYLKSNLVNAFFLEANNENQKNADISYSYRKEDGSIEEKNVSSEAQIKKIYNAHDNVYNYFYEIPLVTDQAGELTITSKMHRTSEIERVFKESNFENLPLLLKNQNNSIEDKEAATLTLSKYNDFLNKYIKYIDSSTESYTFFKNVILTDGRITLSSLSQVQESLKYVFVTATATINVTAIKLQDFSSMTNPREYDVTLSPSDEVLFSVSGNNANNIVEDFGLKIKTDNEDAIGSDEKKDYMFETLSVKPYLYLNVDSIVPEDLDEEKGIITWADREYKFTTVYGFDGHSPIVICPADPEVFGYLLLLENKDEFISVSQLEVNGEKHWKLSCNVPMVKDQSTIISKALYLGFEVSGIGSNTNSIITIEAFTRIYINYEDLDFTYEDVNNISINKLDKYMSINTSDIEINSNSDYYDELTVGRYTQDITNNVTDSTVANLSTATYQNVMYFAETASNRIDGEYPKIATVGKYNFVNYNKANSGNSSFYMYDEGELIGERIATYRVVNNEKQYYLHALNASTIPVKLFAVVYLSDKEGKPIDVNGRLIKIENEGKPSETPYTLVVLRISEITEKDMPSVYIESYVENINFYTKSSIKYQISVDGSTVDFGTGDFINRNHLNYFTNSNGERVSDKMLDEIKDFLTIKLLKDNYFTIYITNFDLALDGSIADSEEGTQVEIICKGIRGETLNIGYNILIKANKQFAFNALCEDLDNYSLYTDSQQVKVYGTPKVMTENGETWIAGTDMDATMIRFILHSSKDDNANIDPKIYLNPENSLIPYSKNLIYSDGEGHTQEERNNFVVYHTNKFEIEDISLYNQGSGYLSLQNKLYAKYAKMTEGVNKGDLVFNYNTEYGTGQYSLPIEGGDINFTYINNIKNGNDINLEIVDCSQAETIDKPSDMEGVYFYESLSSYFNYLLLGNNRTISYTTAKSVISLAEDVYFTNVLQDVATTKINFGSKQFDFTTTGVNGSVNINEYNLDVECVDSGKNVWQLTIPKGTIFPLIDGNKALIYNELFEITTSDNINYYIKDYINKELGITGRSIKVNKTAYIMLSDGTVKAYNASDYIDDRNGSAIVKDSEYGNSTASVNFLQGEELGRFVEDSEGKYKKVVDKTNENSYTYEPLDGTEAIDIQKYSISGLGKDGSKMGVKVYLLVTNSFMFNNETNSYEYTFYKAIEYELLQEEIELVGYNSPGTSSEAVNSNINAYEIDKTTRRTTIMLGADNNSGAYISIKANNENYFFEHVDFNIIDTTINVEFNVNNNSITIDVPDLVSDEAFAILMEYEYKKETRKFKFYVKVNANVKFTNKAEVPIKDISFTEKAYVLSLEEGTQNSIDSIFGNSAWFDIDARVEEIILQDDNNNKYSGTDEIVLPDVNAEFDGSYINYGSKVYEIILKVDEKEIKLNYKLCIEVIPDYLIDATRVEDNTTITMYDGDMLFGEYIRLYNGNAAVSDLSNVTKILPSDDAGYATVYELTADEDSINLLEPSDLAEGRIKLRSTPSQDTTLNLSVKYTTYNGTQSTHNFTVVVRGITMKYSPTGTIGTGSDARTLDENIEIEVSQDTTSIDITKYLSFALSNTNEVNEAVTAVLLNSFGEPIYTITELSDGAVYTIAYMKSSYDSAFTLVGSVGYTITIRLMTN